MLLFKSSPPAGGSGLSASPPHAKEAPAEKPYLLPPSILDKGHPLCYGTRTESASVSRKGGLAIHAPVAQLVEYIHGKDVVSGSIPLGGYKRREAPFIWSFA